MGNDNDGSDRRRSTRLKSVLTPKATSASPAVTSRPTATPVSRKRNRIDIAATPTPRVATPALPKPSSSRKGKRKRPVVSDNDSPGPSGNADRGGGLVNSDDEAQSQGEDMEEVQEDGDDGEDQDDGTDVDGDVDDDNDDDSDEDSDRDTIWAERVLAQKTKGGRKLFLVKWEGFSDDANEWVPEEEVEADLIAQFRASKAKGRVSRSYEDTPDNDAKPARKKRRVTVVKIDVDEEAEAKDAMDVNEDGEPLNKTRKRMAKVKVVKPVRVTKASILAAEKAAIKTRIAARALIPSETYTLSILPDDQDTPDTTCCPGCSTNEFSRALEIPSDDLLNAVLDERQKIGPPDHSCKPDVPHDTAVFRALVLNDVPALKLLYDDFDRNPRRVAWKTMAASDTGHVSNRTFGHAIAALNESRGNREGNNAFLCGLADEIFTCSPKRREEHGHHPRGQMSVTTVLTATDIHIETFDYWHTRHRGITGIIGQYGIYEVAAAGRIGMCRHLVKSLTANDGYGFNELHNAVMNPVDGGSLPTYRKNQILKKATGNSAITPLQLAAINPSPTFLQELIEKLDPSEATEPDERGRTVLHFAAACSEPDGLEFLLARGMDCSKEDKLRHTPLLLAARYGRARNLEVLLKANGMDPDHTMLKDKSRALHFAAFHGHLEAVRVLVLAGAAIDAPATKTKFAPLHLAAMRGHLDVVAFLLEKKAELQPRDRFGRVPLIHAAKNGHFEVCKHLLLLGSNLEASDTSNNTALHYAAAFGWRSLVHLLLVLGADPNARNCWQSTPISITDLKGHSVDQLLAVPEVDVNTLDPQGATMLHNLTTTCPQTPNESERMLNKARALLTRGADPGIKDQEGRTALHRWATTDLIAQQGVEQGVPRSEEERKREIEAAWRELGNLLMDAGSDLNAKTKSEETPLQIALAKKNFVQAVALMSRKASLKGSNVVSILSTEIAEIESSCVVPNWSRDLRAHGDHPTRERLRTKAEPKLAEIWKMCEILKDADKDELKEVVEEPDDQGFRGVVGVVKKAGERQIQERDTFLSASTHVFGTGGGTFGNSTVSGTKIVEMDLTWDATIAFVNILVNDFGADVSGKVTLPDGYKPGDDQPVHTGWSALHYAAKWQDPTLLKFLLDKGCGSTSTPESRVSTTPLHLALELPPAAFPKTCNAFTLQFTPPRTRWEACIKLLLDAKVDPTIPAIPDGLSPLQQLSHLTLRPTAEDETIPDNDTGPPRISISLLQAFLTACPLQRVDSMVEEQGDRALNAFVRRSNLAAVRILLDLGADVNVRNAKTNETVVMRAVLTKNMDLVRLILDVRTSDLAVVTSTWRRKTALLLALERDTSETAVAILETGRDCNVDHRDSTGSAALHLAAAKGFVDVVELLLAAGADRELRSGEKGDEGTPLVKAVQNGQRDVIEALLRGEKRSDVNVMTGDGDGRWALHVAVKRNDWKMVKMLLDAGARTDVKDKNLSTPLHLAIEDSKGAVNTSLRLERLLLAAGAPINAVDVQGRTPLHIAFVDILQIPAMHISEVQADLQASFNAAEKKREAAILALKKIAESLLVDGRDEEGWILAPERKKAEARRRNAKEDEAVEFRGDSGKEWFTNRWEKRVSNAKADPIEIVSYLLSVPNIQPDLPDKFGRTPLHYAGRVGAFTSSSYLINKGAVVDRPDRDTNRPIDVGLLHEHIDFAVMLAKTGAGTDGSVVPSSGVEASVFRYTLSKGFMSLAYMIMEKGVDVLNAISDALTTGKFHLAVLLITRASRQELLATTSSSCQTLLHVIVDHRPLNAQEWVEYSVEIYDAIRSLGLDPLRTDSQGRAALHYAAMYGHEEIVRILVQVVDGKEWVVKDNHGRTALSYAMADGNKEVIQMILEQSFQLPSETEFEGPTLAHYAAMASDVRVLQSLIAKGVALNDVKVTTDGLRRTPLVVALQKKDTAKIRALLEAGADLNLPAFQEEKDTDLVPPIFAVLTCDVPKEGKGILEMLLKAGADPNILHPHSGFSPLQTVKDKNPAFDVLIKYKGNVNLPHPTDHRTPFQMALYRCRSHQERAKCVERFAEVNVDVNRIDEESGQTVVDHAILQCDPTFLDAVLLKGADITVLSTCHDPSDNTSLMLCAILDRTDCLKRILSNARTLSLDYLNARNSDGQTLAHLIVAPRPIGLYENVAMLALAVDRGLDLEVANKKGLRAIDLAYTHKSKVMYKKLLELGSKDAVAKNPEAGRNSMDVDRVPIMRVDVEADADMARSDIVAAAKIKEAAMQVQRAKDLGLSPAELEKQERHAACKLDPYIGLTSLTAEVVFDEEHDTPYDVMMTKTDLSRGHHGSNSFYKMQLAHDRLRNSYVLLTRFGGLGEDGMHQRTPFPTAQEAILEFTKIFKTKSGNVWDPTPAGAESYERKPGRYWSVSKKIRDHVPVPTPAFNHLKDGSPRPVQAQAVTDFFRLVSDLPALETAVHDSHLDLEIGNVDRKTVQAANAILKEIKERLEEKGVLDLAPIPDVKALKSMNETLVKLSSQYYSIMPSTGDRHCGLRPITNRFQLTREMQRLADLQYVDSASMLLLAAHSKKDTVHPTDYLVDAVRCEFRHVNDREGDEFQIVEEYLHDTRESSKHEIVHLFAVKKDGEHERFQPFEKEPTKLLWHGSRSSNFLGILHQGLRITPCAANGSMFGRGLYFGSMFAKSISYAVSPAQFPSYSCLLLCDVAVGEKPNELEQSQNMDKAPGESICTIGLGMTGPSRSLSYPDGVVVPQGPVQEHVLRKDSSGHPIRRSLRYDEYIVYDAAQVRIRYVVLVRDASTCILCEKHGFLKTVADYRDQKFAEDESAGVVFEGALSKNAFEKAACAALIHARGDSVERIWKEFVDRYVSENLYESRFVCATELQMHSEICNTCSDIVCSEALYAYMVTHRNDLPVAVRDRPNCWYGRECRNQKTAAHARTFNHIAPNLRQPGDNLVFAYAKQSLDVTGGAVCEAEGIRLPTGGSVVANKKLNVHKNWSIELAVEPSMGTVELHLQAGAATDVRVRLDGALKTVSVLTSQDACLATASLPASPVPNRYFPTIRWLAKDKKLEIRTSERAATDGRAGLDSSRLLLSTHINLPEPTADQPSEDATVTLAALPSTDPNAMDVSAATTVGEHQVAKVIAWTIWYTLPAVETLDDTSEETDDDD
ncbi:hypothetical protein HKX48_002982 [Thoreauomyces humboldtii]|nr:hypothetical protein HKX48_002982 [Thoreauomyces humboldtii]